MACGYFDFWMQEFPRCWDDHNLLGILTFKPESPPWILLSLFQELYSQISLVAKFWGPLVKKLETDTIISLLFNIVIKLIQFNNLLRDHSFLFSIPNASLRSSLEICYNMSLFGNPIFYFYDLPILQPY